MAHLKTVVIRSKLSVGIPDFTKNDKSSIVILGGSELSWHWDWQNAPRRSCCEGRIDIDIPVTVCYLCKTANDFVWRVQCWCLESTWSRFSSPRGHSLPVWFGTCGHQKTCVWVSYHDFGGIDMFSLLQTFLVHLTGAPDEIGMHATALLRKVVYYYFRDLVWLFSCAKLFSYRLLKNKQLFWGIFTCCWRKC